MFVLRTHTIKILRNPVKYLFSGEFDESKIETVSFKKNTINDFSKIAYEPQQKLNFVNGKCLIYQNNRSWARAFLQSTLYWIPITGISYLIYTNPFADVFPAAIPILAVFDFVLLKLWLNKIKWNQNIVSEMYLFENGEATEIYFANKLKRKLFGEEQRKIYYNSLFVNPDFEKQEVILLNRDRRVFPTSQKQAEATSSGYAWVKYFSNGQNFFVIPKNPKYMNLKILIQIFKGKIIKNKLI